MFLLGQVEGQTIKNNMFLKCWWMNNSISFKMIPTSYHICRSPKNGVMTPGWSGQSLMTSISGHEGEIDLKNGGTHRLVIINQQTKFHQHRRRSCKFLIDLT